MTIKAVIFDLDDTLCDEKLFIKSGFQAVSSYMAKKYGVNETRFYHLLLSIFSKQGRKNVFDLTLKKLAIYKRSVVLEMVKVYRSHFPNIALFKEAEELLPKMKKKYLTGLITDGFKTVQETKVKALDIEGFFNVIIYAVEHGGKSSMQPFLLTLERLHVRASESIYVDNDPMKGFTVAKKLGIHTVRILRGETRNISIVDAECKPEFEIHTLRELFRVISAIEKSNHEEHAS